MSVRVRLTRVGSRKNPVWRVVVADQRSPRDGRVIETVGRYDPRRRPSEIILDRERLSHWIERGASPTRTVRRLMQADDRETPPASATAGNEQPSAPPAKASAPDKDAGASDDEAPGAGAPDTEAVSAPDVDADAAGADAAASDDETAAASEDESAEAPPDAAAQEGTPVPPDEPSDEKGPAAEVPAEEAPDGATPADDAPGSSG